MKPISIIVITFLLTGCAVPEPLVKLSPSTIQNQDYWNLGQQFVYSNDKNIWFDMGFNRVEYNTIIYDVKITNLSDSAILVDPATFVQYGYKNDSLKITSDNASDPEFILSFLVLDENIANARARNASTVSLFSAVVATGASVAVVVAEKNEEKKEQLLETIDVANTVTQISSNAVEESSNIRAENNWNKRCSLAEALLRKTTLPSGFYIDGEVRFPFHKEATWYTVNLKANKAKSTFFFKQKLIYPEYNTQSNNYNLNR